MEQNGNTNEVWKDIIGFEGRYQVSNMGRVRNAKRHILSPSKYQGYLRVNLSFGEKRKYKTISIHRLVAIHFVEGYSEGLEVNHKDENPANNVFTNLEWISHAKNVVHGTFTPRRMATLHKTKRIRNVIQKDLSGNVIALYNSIKEASNKSGVPYMTIKNILRYGLKRRRDYIWEFAEE